MKTVFLALLALLVIVSGEVVVLTPDNIDSVLDGSKHALVEFYAPWCGHCKSLEPEYNDAGAAFANSEDVVIAKVDADAHRDLGEKYGIRGFPTLKWFAKGETEPTDYDGARSADGIVKFINEKTNGKVIIPKKVSPVKALDPSDFDESVSGKYALIKFFAPWCGHCKKLAHTFEKLATAFKDEEKVLIADVDCDEHKDLCQKYEVTGYPTIKWFSPSGDVEPYSSGRDLGDLVKFVNQKASTFRSESGDLEAEAGRIPEFDALAVEFASESDADKRKEILSDAEKLLVEKEDGKYYVTAMKKVLDKGNDFIPTEIARLWRMISSGSVSPKKSGEFAVRVNILKAFAAAPEAQEE